MPDSKLTRGERKVYDNPGNWGPSARPLEQELKIFQMVSYAFLMTSYSQRVIYSEKEK